MPRDELARLARALDQVAPPEKGLVRALKCEYQISANMIDDLRDGKIDLEGRKTTGSTLLIPGQ